MGGASGALKRSCLTFFTTNPPEGFYVMFCNIFRIATFICQNEEKHFEISITVYDATFFFINTMYVHVS